jgi:hypothetical protein
LRPLWPWEEKGTPSAGGWTVAWGPGRHSQRKTKNTHPAKSETFVGATLHDVLKLTLRLARAAPNLNSAPPLNVTQTDAHLRPGRAPTPQNSPRLLSPRRTPPALGALCLLGGVCDEPRQAVWVDTTRLGRVAGRHHVWRSTNVAFLIGVWPSP